MVDYQDDMAGARVENVNAAMINGPFADFSRYGDV